MIHGRKWFSFVLVLVAVASVCQAYDALSANAASLEPHPSYCAPAAAGANYVTADDFERLRSRSRDIPMTSTAFSRLSEANSLVVVEALRVGPGAAFFAARLLRDLAVIEALDLQERCETARCAKPPIIREFKTDEPGDPNVNRSWGELKELWIGFRDNDADAAQSCLKIAKLLPTAPPPKPMVVAETPHTPGTSTDHTRDSNDVAVVPSPRPSSSVSSIARELAGLDPAEVRFCQSRPSDSTDNSEVTDDQLRQLREGFRQASSPAFAGMNAKYREPLEEALRVGPTTAYFARRTLRNLIIIEKIDRQINCSDQQTCPLSDDLRALKRNDSWQDSLTIWKSVRETDFQRALACMAYSRTLPTRELFPAVASKVDESNRLERGHCERAAAIEMVTLRFPKNGYNVGKDELRLATVTGALLRCPSLKAVIAGHTDQDGPRAYNLKLSDARASSVAKQLISAGVKGPQIETAGYGASHLLSKALDRGSKAQNRRAEVVIRKISVTDLDGTPSSRR
jgi:outer membrane protein OmpA-like peptidoglycan-associated protein